MRRRTSQRRAIVEALRSAHGPLTPQELLERASREQQGLGLATVYRNLSALEADGEVVAVHLPNDSTRYEPAGRSHHHHFRCRSCERVFELETPCPLQKLHDVVLPGGFQVDHHDLTLYGTCPECEA